MTMNSQTTISIDIAIHFLLLGDSYMAAPAAGQSQVQRSQNASLLYLQTSSVQSDRYLATILDFRAAALSLCRHMQVRLQWARKQSAGNDCYMGNC